MAEQDDKCAYCGMPIVGNEYHVDHFLPIKLDGAHMRQNLVIACPKCNLSKGAKHPIAFLEQMNLMAELTSEAREQARLVIWTHRVAVRKLMPSLEWLHHSPNGEKRDGFTGGKLKAMGTKKGFLDLILPVRNATGAPGMLIEMKHGKGRESAEQLKWIDHFLDQGWFVSVCYSAEEARADICTYFGIDPATAPALDA